MQDDQRIARVFGVLFIMTFITSISALALFQSVLDDPAAYIAGGGKDNQIYLGAFLEFLLFDWWDQTGAVSLLVIPEFIWEAFLGIYCAIWGFRKDSPILRPTWRGGAAA